jgi:hypothetical protein
MTRSTTTRRTLAAVLTATLLLAGTVTTASATPQGHTAEDHLAGRFYGNFDLGVLLFTGDEVTNICTGAAEPVVSARVFDRQDGSTELKVHSGDMPIFLYRSSRP